MMYHSINIGAKNTWDDWHLVSASRPLVNPPTVKTHFVNVRGRNGSLDLTEVVSGRAAYGNRTGSWEFIVVNSGQLVPNSSYGEWYTRYTQIMTYLNGREYRAILEDDPEYYYRGRFAVAGWNSAKGNSILTINYNLGPYKKYIHDGSEPWEWDPFNLETGVIRTYKNLIVRNSLAIDYVTERPVLSPIIYSYPKNGIEMRVSYEGTTYILHDGENRMTAMSFHEGTNQLTFMGEGQISIEASGGIL